MDSIFKIASFNTNGIRPRTPIILDWLSHNDPHVVGIQETKTQDPDFPEKPFVEAGYHVVYRGQKSYNGVAILSKLPFHNVVNRLFVDEEDEEARFMCVQLNNSITVVNTYVPQGQKPDSEKFRFKLKWYEKLLAYFHSTFDPDHPVIWLGDLNVAPTSLDVYDPEKLYGSVCYHPDEHAAFKKFIEFGFVDIYRMHNPDQKEFTFWDYRIPNAVKRGLGWRIDHILATRCMAQKSISSWIDKTPRLLPKPSDHTFIVAGFKL